MSPALPLALALVCFAEDPARPSAVDLVTALETVMADTIARAEPSVVAIARDKKVNVEITTAVRGRTPEPRNDFPPGVAQFRLQEFGVSDLLSFDFGSGVVIGNNGEILTAYNVVKGASRLLVRAAGGQEFEAEVIAADPRSDLAVIAPAASLPTKPRLKPIAIGDASNLRKGMFMIALGNPFNAARDGNASATWGILSNIARRLDPQNLDDRQLRHFPTLLQLDSKLNLGMSGGAVINMKGELVGLTTNAANASGFDAQAGYAMPIDKTGLRVIKTLMEGKEVEYGFLGINLPDDQSNRVGGAGPGTPAAEGGLLVDDQILTVGGVKVTDADTLVAAVNSFGPGEPIKLEILRAGVPLTKTVVLAKFPIKGEVIATNRPQPWRGIRVDYSSMLPNVNQFGVSLLEAMSRGGVGVIEVVPGSPADEAGLRSGQIIRAVGESKVKTPAEFAKAVEGLKGAVELITDGNRSVTIEEGSPLK